MKARASSRARASNLDNRARPATKYDARRLIAAVSKTIENYCWRTFAVTSYDEVYPALGGAASAALSGPSVERVARAPASAAVTTRLQRAASTVKSRHGCRTDSRRVRREQRDDLFADQATLAALATAITARGNGWSASVIDAADDLRASADLRALQGALHAKNVNAELKLHRSELSSFLVDAERGCLTHESGWHGSLHHWRIVYRAGYSAVPDDVQEACAQWVAQLFWLTKRDPGLASESIPSAISRVVLRDMPVTVRLLLGAYRNWRV